ncbi:flavodoxin family protein [Limosilactobacillus albertensis]|uniref:Flavodoxin-like domain-containing protein n=1 Tax=Limosilactobacillus albertensis TaxID=2759752 RepID=A0A839HAG8_9LACO|nr:hypothetical protein [Limosilactobacillus albertensis]MBB1124178.1 hypothetical protein [Limosilactobacillus albertensis]MCD7122030.1 hypothetical protein [Limosilactobacillus albertensis]
MNKQVVYFSNSGNNKRLAQRIADYNGLSAIPIIPTNTYPSNYHELTSRARQERFHHIDVQIHPVKLAKNTDTLILVSPIWYADLPRPVITFLKQLQRPYQRIIFVSDKFMLGFGFCRRTLRKYVPSSTNIEMIAATSNDFSTIISILKNS